MAHNLIKAHGFDIGHPIYPDETLFSWCSRYHRLTANVQDWVSCWQLFGSRRIGLAHDFPGKIDAFVARTNGMMGDSEALIMGRTVLPFYLAFRPQQLGVEAIRAMRDSGIGHLKYRLGLITSGLGAGHPLKICPECIDDDMNNAGWSWWRRTQQLPGVWVCKQHQRMLYVSDFRLQQAGQRIWALPMQMGCQAMTSLSSLSTQEDFAWLCKLGSMANELALIAPGTFDDPVSVGQTIRKRLIDLGLANHSGRIRWHEIEPMLKTFAGNFGCLPECRHEADPMLLRSQLLRILSGRSLTHPLRYLQWITPWFDDLDDFYTAYQGLVLNWGGEESVALPPSSISVSANKPKDGIRLGAGSLTNAAALNGVDYSTMARWATLQGVALARRPKKLNEALWATAVSMLSAGAEKSHVSHEIDVSLVTVHRILQRVPGLHDQWRAAREDVRRHEARRAWHQIGRLHGHLGIKQLRVLQPAAYAWLSRHDQTWFEEYKQKMSQRKSGNHATRRIENADIRMANALRELALSMGVKPKLWDVTRLQRAMPAMSKVLNKPAAWPLTVKALREALQSRLHVSPSMSLFEDSLA